MNSKYRSMVKRMQEKQAGTRKKPASETWYLYMVRCQDQSLYTGIAKDVTRRIQMHNDKKGARYTRPRIPVTLVYCEKLAGRTEALVRECEVKAYSKKKKEEMALSGQISI